MALSSRRRKDSLDIWPGFVDALGALLIVVIFLLMIFSVSQFFLAQLVSGQDSDLEDLRREVGRLEQQLVIEKDGAAEMRITNNRLSNDLQSALAQRDDLNDRVGRLEDQRNSFEDKLAEQLTEAAKLRDQAATLRQRNQSLQDQLRDIRTARDSLAMELDTLELDRERLKADLADAGQISLEDKRTIETQLIEMERLQADLVALRAVRTELEAQVLTLVASLETAQELQAGLESNIETEQQRTEELASLLLALRAQLADTEGTLASEQERTQGLAEQLVTLFSDLTAARDQNKDLAERLSTEEERTALAQQEASQNERLVNESFAEIQLLNQQLASVRETLASLREALDASEAENASQAAEILTLGDRLNAALATELQRLKRYRSEFFGQVREVLEGRDEIRIVGDRFILQSEVLFPSGSATLQEGGKAQIARLADIILEISGRIPEEVDWLLQIEGHTDTVPINTAQFPSNWELSTARAISVLQEFVTQGVPSRRIAAAGYAEFQPIAPNATAEGRSRNRRIEVKLTSRNTADGG